MDSTCINSVADIEAQCFSSPWPVESFINVLNNQSIAYFVALIDNKVVGYIGMYNLIDEISIINIAVDKNYRNQGIAQKLLEKTEAFACSHSVPSIVLEVRVSNMPARTLYEKNGYIEYAREPNYYTNPKEDAILYRKNIGDQQC